MLNTKHPSHPPGLTISKEKIFEVLAEIKDPEVPVLDIVELGIVRDVAFEKETLRVDITPTYSGCPAMQAIEDEIISTLHAKGFENVVVKKVFSPIWTTDWLSEDAKKKLKEYGIAPPEKTSEENPLATDNNTKTTRCPFCNSIDTELKSQFGSTACKALYYCNACSQPFEHFKCI